MRLNTALIVKSRCFRVCDIVVLLLLLACEDFKLLVVLLCGHAWLLFCVFLLTKTAAPCVAGRFRNGFVGVYLLSVFLRKSQAFLLEGMGRKYLYFSREKQARKTEQMNCLHSDRKNGKQRLGLTGNTKDEAKECC